MKQVYIIGATGRSGTSVASFLATKQVPLVLVGRRLEALQAMADSLSKQTQTKIVMADSIESICQEVSKAENPIVIANFIGPFCTTAVSLVKASPVGSHYVDISNECRSFEDIFGLHEQALKENRCLVVGAGFGVVASEATVMKACAEKKDSPPLKLRVDTIPYVKDTGPIGPTIAATIVEKLHDTGKIYQDGKLKDIMVGTLVIELTLPDQATTVKTGSAPQGDLMAAQRVSGAPNVVAASSAVPMSSLNYIVMPIMRGLVTFPAIKRLITRRVENMMFPSSPFQHSYSHVKAEWADGSTKEVWLRLGDGTDFTNMACGEVTYRLASGDSKPGAYTPGALYGIDLALSAGAEFL